jgi:hypothetical protein
MTVGDVLQEAWDLYRRFFWGFVLTAAVVYVVLATRFIALTGVVLYFCLARFSAGVDPANPTLR